MSVTLKSAETKYLLFETSSDDFSVSKNAKVRISGRNCEIRCPLPECARESTYLTSAYAEGPRLASSNFANVWINRRPCLFLTILKKLGKYLCILFVVTRTFSETSKLCVILFSFLYPDILCKYNLKVSVFNNVVPIYRISRTRPHGQNAKVVTSKLSYVHILAI